MKPILVLVLLVRTITYAHAQEDFTFNQGWTTQRDYFSVIPYENVRSKIIVDVTLAGESYKFLVDTGAPTVINRKLYDKLKPIVLNRVPITDQSGKEDSLEVVLLPSLTFGGVEFTNLATLMVEDTLIFNCFQVDGFIGSNMLRNSIIQLNNDQKTITLTDNERKLGLNPKKGSPMTLTDIQSTPFVWINLTGKKKKARNEIMFDSGMDGMYDLSLRHLYVFEKKDIFTVLSKSSGSNSLGIYGTADDTLQYRLRLPKLEINGTTLTNVSIQTTPDNNSRMGSRLLELGVVTLDFRNRKFYFNPYPGRSLDMFRKDFPIDPVYRDGQLRIGIVWKEALRDTLHPGDQILAIDDMHYGHIDLCTLITKEPAFKDNPQITLTVRDKTGIVQKVTITQE